MTVILSFSLARGNFFKTLFNQSWDLILFFLILLVGQLYTTDFELGLRQLETSLSLVGIPLVFCNLNVTKERFVNAFYAFIFGVFIAGTICLGSAIFSFSQTAQWSVFFFHNFTDVIDSHPTYFAYILIFVITYGLYLLYYELPKQWTVLCVGLIVFFFIVLLLTGGQTVFIALLLVFSFFASKYLLEQKARRTSLVIALVIVLLACMFGTVILFQTNDEFRMLSDQNDYWERIALWESAIHANTNPLFGVGTGDYNMVLNDYYLTHALPDFAAENLNSHNQFIQLYFSNGIIGLVGLLIILARPLYLSVRSQNLLGILLYFPFLIYGITEVFLNRYQGVVFLSFAHQILLSNDMATKPVKGFSKVAKL